MRSTISEMALFVSRWVELSILVKATLMLALGLTSAWLAGRGRASVRHLFLVATFGMLLALPLVMLIAPRVTIVVPVSRAIDLSVAPGAVPTSGPLAPRTNAGVGRLEPASTQWILPSWRVMLRLAWLVGAVVLFVSLAVAFWRLRRIRRDGLPWPEQRELT